MEKECLLVDFNRDFNDLVGLDKRLQHYELKPIYESAVQLLPSKDLSDSTEQGKKWKFLLAEIVEKFTTFLEISIVALETLYILSRHGPTWSEFDGRALFEQLLNLLLANGPNLERDNVKIILLKILTNTGFHLGEFYHAPRYRKKKFLAKFEIGTKIWSNSSVKILIQNLFQAVNSKKFT